ncbi:MAG: C1 family peptidase [Acidobacteriota bacterium]
MAKRKASAKESQRICNLVPSRNTENDWQYETAVRSAALTAVAAPPPSKDLRAAWWTIGDQENTGSCVGWASTDGVMRYHLVTAGKLGQKERVSPRGTWMASKETDEFTQRPETFIEGAGTSLKSAMDICRKYGVVPETMLPFHITTTMFLGNEDQYFATAAQRKCSAYFNLLKNFSQWRTWLASTGPIMVGLNVDATWDNATATKGLLDAFQPNTTRGGHAVCLVGYTKDGRFIVRNSWGTGWGDKGFAYATEAYITGAFFNESYGITL